MLGIGASCHRPDASTSVWVWCVSAPCQWSRAHRQALPCANAVLGFAYRPGICATSCVMSLQDCKCNRNDSSSISLGAGCWAWHAATGQRGPSASAEPNLLAVCVQDYTTGKSVWAAFWEQIAEQNLQNLHFGSAPANWGQQVAQTVACVGRTCGTSPVWCAAALQVYPGITGLDHRPSCLSQVSGPHMPADEQQIDDDEGHCHPQILLDRSHRWAPSAGVWHRLGRRDSQEEALTGWALDTYVSSWTLVGKIYMETN